MNKRSHRIWKWLIILLLAGVAGGYYWSRLPRTFKPVAAIPISDSTFAPTVAGILVKEGVGAKTAFVLHSWQDGSALWHVTPPVNAGIQRGLKYPSDYPWSISPSGHVFAAVVFTGDGGGQRVMTWKDGKLLGAYEGRPLIAARLRALDDGRVFYYSGHPGTVSSLVSGSKVLARGTLLSGRTVMIAPDGSFMAASSVLRGTGVGPTTAATIQIRNSRLVLCSPYTVNAEPDYSVDINSNTERILCANGRWLTKDGSLYGPTGFISSGPGTGWECISQLNLSTDRNKVAWLCGKTMPGEPAKPYRVRVVTVKNGTSHEVCHGYGNIIGASACDNGNVILERWNSLPIPLLLIAQSIPGDHSGCSHDYLLFDQRGHLLACRRLVVSTLLGGISIDGVNYQDEHEAASPDGSSLAFCCADNPGQMVESDSNFMLLLYRF